MSKEENLTESERLFILRRRCNQLLARMNEIDVWLSTAGRRGKTSADERVKASFINERQSIAAQVEVVQGRIKELEAEVVERDAKRKLAQASGVSSSMVTDHALVRWLERKHGINILEMKEALWREAKDAWTTGRISIENDRGIRATKGELVYVMSKDRKNVLTCYTLVEEDTFNR